MFLDTNLLYYYIISKTFNTKQRWRSKTTYRNLHRMVCSKLLCDISALRKLPASAVTSYKCERGAQRCTWKCEIFFCVTEICRTKDFPLLYASYFLSAMLFWGFRIDFCGLFWVFSGFVFFPSLANGVKKM